MENKMTRVVRIGFINPETGNMDETEFDTANHIEAMYLFRDFCMENNFGTPKILYADACRSRE